MENESEVFKLLLKQQYLFQGLDDDQIARVVTKFKSITLDPGTILISQGKSGDCFFVVARGKVVVTQGIGQRERQKNILKPGDYFGEEALLLHRLSSSTFRTSGRTTLLRLEYEQFFDLLQEFPGIRQNLSATAESRHLVRREKFEWLGEDEVIYLVSRKHEFFLITSLLLPIFMGVASIPILVYSFASGGGSLMLAAGMIVGALMLFGAIIWGIWNFMDWGNDFYIVTNRRVIWKEKIIGLYDSRSEAPLDSILALNVVSSQLGRIIGYGNVKVRTFTGGILMRNLRNPHRFTSFVEGFKKHVIEVSKEEEAREMQRDLERSLRRLSVSDSGEEEPGIAPPSPPTAAPAPEKKKKTSGWQEKWQTFLKVRYEHEGCVTYRKHWYILGQKIWLPLFALFIIILIFGYLWLRFGIISQLTLDLLFGLLFGGVFLWLVYEYLDWRNDIYRVTPTHILDIERKPLGKEVKQTAPLKSILSVEHERESLIGILLNFGTVIINIGETKFIFHGVFNPDQVHQDVADYREALNRRKREAEKVRERKRMVDWLVTYYKEAERLEEEIEGKSNLDQISG